jgi:hypothetical protein
MSGIFLWLLIQFLNGLARGLGNGYIERVTVIERGFS